MQRFGGDVGGSTIALWGLAFKPNTDGMCEAPSRAIVTELARRGARIRAYDPVAAGQGSCALAIVTELKEFRTPDFEVMRTALRTPVVFDGRNLYEPALMAAFGFEYHCIGRAVTLPSRSAQVD